MHLGVQHCSAFGSLAQGTFAPDTYAQGTYVAYSVAAHCTNAVFSLPALHQSLRTRKLSYNQHNVCPVAWDDDALTAIRCC